VELEPDNANSYDSLGDGWMAKGRLDEAINAYRKALALNPMFPSSMRSLGTALEQAGRRDEAIQHYRHCAQLGAQNGVAKVVTESKTRLNALGVKE
jgi:tetratricopeptide (TPR) repeat protein